MAKAAIVLFIATVLVGLGAAVGYHRGVQRAESEERDRCAAVTDSLDGYLTCVEKTGAP